MADTTKPGAERSVPRWILWSYGGGALISGAIAVYALVESKPAVFAMGLLGLVVVGAMAPIAILLVSRGSGGTDVAALGEAIDRIAEQNALSDDARRVLNRRRERELLCKAIEEDLAVEDYDAAMVLCKELAEQFGYRAEAEDFRTRIEHVRREGVERRITDAIRELDDMIVQRRWNDAMMEAARIGRLYPDSPRVEGLRHRVEQARALYKSDLETRFLHAAQAEQLEHAMDVLRELDMYLTEAEAGPLREVARGVITKTRENLGAQFKLAVKNRQWSSAVELGDRILDEFPRTRMADEIRNVIDELRVRASSPATA